MGVRVYTERFVACFGAQASVTYTVPVGKRAVVTSVVVTQVSGNVALAQVVIGPAVVYQRMLQAEASTTTLTMRCVAYGGEVIAAFTAAAGIYVSVGGYLFDDALAATGPPPGLSEKPSPGPWELELAEVG